VSISYKQAKEYFTNNSFSLSAIEKQFGYDRKLLSKQLKLEGITIPLNNQQYTYNVDYFSSINSEEKAYWLGFLYADGYVATKNNSYLLELTLKSDDLEHLNKFKSALCPENKIYAKTIRFKNKTYSACRISVCNKQIVADLIQLGCVNCKSSILVFPTIPTNLNRHFIRGYFDGDGNVGKYNNKLMFSISSGSFDFLVSIQSVFKQEIDNYTETKIKKDKRAEVYSLQKGGNISVGKILRYLYSDASVFLDRKYAIFGTLPSENEISQIISAE
jgi:hypothetical protein